MLKKLHFFLVLGLFSVVTSAQQDSVRIQKAALLFCDSTEIMPVMFKVPYDEAIYKTLSLIRYKNEGQLLSNYTLEFRITHVSFPAIQGGPGLGLIHRKRLVQDTLLANEVKYFKLNVPGYNLCYLGNYRADFFIYNNIGVPLDSAFFIFDITDSVYFKSNMSTSLMTTGPSLFSDTVLNQLGGTAQGDRFGTLFEINNLLGISSAQGFYRPTSISFFVSNDTSNIGAEIVPKIWSATIDSISNEIIVGPEVASSFIPTLIDSSHLGRMISLILDNGTAVFNALSAGKYVVGFEATLPNPNGKSLLIGRDTIGELIQPDGTSFVYFGHDTNWYSVSDQPIMGLNLANLPYLWFGIPGSIGCSTVELMETNTTELDIQIYPNPSNGTFTLEHSASIQTFEVYNVNGKLIEASIINNQLDLSNEPNGIYLLRVQLESGEIVSKKLMKH